MFFQDSQELQFSNLLRAAAENALEAANLLSQLLEAPARFDELGPSIRELESKGDGLTHTMFTLINKTFVTPLEREDLAALAVDIDSVVDLMEAASARIGIYKVRQSDRFLREFGVVLRAQCTQLVAAIDLLAGNKLMQIHDRTIQIKQLENQADLILRDGLANLFERAPQDPVRFITMKEIYDFLEMATDQAEDVTDTLEGVVMKHA